MSAKEIAEQRAAIQRLRADETARAAAERLRADAASAEIVAAEIRLIVLQEEAAEAREREMAALSFAAARAEPWRPSLLRAMARYDVEGAPHAPPPTAKHRAELMLHPYEDAIARLHDDPEDAAARDRLLDEAATLLQVATWIVDWLSARGNFPEGTDRGFILMKLAEGLLNSLPDESRLLEHHRHHG